MRASSIYLHRQLEGAVVRARSLLHQRVYQPLQLIQRQVLLRWAGTAQHSGGAVQSAERLVCPRMKE